MDRRDSKMEESKPVAGIDTSGLRERLPQNPETPQKAESVQTAEQTVRALNEAEQNDDKAEKDKKTYGRTLDGTGEYMIPGALNLSQAPYLHHLPHGSDIVGNKAFYNRPRRSCSSLSLTIQP